LAFRQATQANYDAFLFGRRTALPAVTVPGPLDTPEQKADRFSKRLLRLYPGDEGYITWTLAKRIFSDEVSRLVREAQDDLDSDDDDNASMCGEELAFYTMEDFPVFLETEI
jgi:hypothetical protein